MHSLGQFAFPMPAGLRVAAETVLHSDAVSELDQPSPIFAEVKRIVDEARSWGIKLETSEAFRFAYERALERMAIALEHEPGDRDLLDSLAVASELSGQLEHEIDRWQVQKAYYGVAHSVVYSTAETRAAHDDPDARQWLERFRALGDWLAVVLPAHAG
jgi:hypothetical protein